MIIKNIVKWKILSSNLIPFVFVLFFTVVFGVSCYTNSLIAFYIETMERNLEQRLITTSRWLADLADIEELESFRTISDMELPSYNALRERLLEFSNFNDVFYVYYIRPLEGDRFQYIVDNDFDESTRVGLDTSPFPLSNAPWLSGALAGEIVFSGFGNYTTGWEGLLTGYAPLLDEIGKVILIAGVDIIDRDILNARNMLNIFSVLQVILVIVIFICGLWSILYFKRMARIAEGMSEKLKTVASTDGLTKIANRLSFQNYFDLVWRQCMRLNMPLSVLITDIDYFKKYNDSFGHLEGDKILIAVAQCLKDNLKRGTDFIARFGGEEFVCLLPYLEKDSARVFTEKLVYSVEKMRIPHPESDISKYVTVSAGLATVIPNGSLSQEKLLDLADKALYRAKYSGRNTFTVADI